MSNNRTDLELIRSLVDEGTRILDVGCGNGELLQSLKDKKSVKGQGLELKQERVNQCVSRGLSAIQGNADSDKHFLAFEKSYIVNEDETTSQDWVVQDFSDLIGLDPNSVYNSWIDFDGDNDLDVILMTPVVSNDGLSINYTFKVFLNNSLF